MLLAALAVRSAIAGQVGAPYGDDGVVVWYWRRETTADGTVTETIDGDGTVPLTGGGHSS